MVCLENPMVTRSLVGYSPWGHKESDNTVHRPERPAGSKHSSTRGLWPPEQLERQAGFPSSLESLQGRRDLT